MVKVYYNRKKFRRGVYMLCRNCGSQIPDDSVYCYKCGSADIENSLDESNKREKCVGVPFKLRLKMHLEFIVVSSIVFALGYMYFALER